MNAPDLSGTALREYDLTACEARSLIANGEMDAGRLWNAARARAVECGPYNPLTMELPEPELVPTGPMSGLPVVLKGNIDVRGVPTTAGTPALAHNIAATDAPIVARLREAGSQIFGVTVMHELALGATSNNTLDGVPRNPWNPAMISGGSSGGSAAAVALGIAPIGIGTDTGGSVRVPAALCGIYGFRPSVGRYPATGIFSLSPTRDTAGPMARSIDDILLADRVLSNREARDLLDGEQSDIVIGVSRSHLADLDPDVGDRFDGAVHDLEEAGFTIVDVDVSDVVTAASDIAVDILWGEASASLTDYLASRSGPELATVFGSTASPDVRALVETGIGSVTAERYTRVIKTLMRLRKRFARTIDHAGVDLVMFPTTPVVAPPIGADTTLMLNGEAKPTFSTVIRHSDLGGTIGLPGISIPVGVGGRTRLPVGIEFTAPTGADDKLLALAHRVSKVIAVETRPSGLPHSRM